MNSRALLSVVCGTVLSPQPCCTAVIEGFGIAVHICLETRPRDAALPAACVKSMTRSSDNERAFCENAGLCLLLSAHAFAPTALPMQHRARLAASSTRPAAAMSLRMSAGAQVRVCACLRIGWKYVFGLLCMHICATFFSVLVRAMRGLSPN